MDTQRNPYIQQLMSRWLLTITSVFVPAKHLEVAEEDERLEKILTEIVKTMQDIRIMPQRDRTHLEVIQASIENIRKHIRETPRNEALIEGNIHTIEQIVLHT